MSQISFELPSHISTEIHSFQTTNDYHHTDTSVWTPTIDGVFSTKYMYPLITSNNIQNQRKSFALLWKLKTLNKVKYFLWQCNYDHLPTKTYLCHIGIDTPLQCLVCLNIEESPEKNSALPKSKSSMGTTRC